MDFFDTSKNEQTHKDEMELLQKQQHEYKYVGSQRKVPGHTMFSFNVKTGEIKVAPSEKCKDVDFKSKEPIRKERLTIEPDCIYRQALNKKNFIKRLKREGIIR